MTTTTATRARHRTEADRRDLGFWAIAFSFLTVLAYNAVPAPLYAIYQQRDGFSSFMLTVIFAAYAVGVVLSLFSVGHLSDVHGRRPLFVPALLFSMASAGIFIAWRALPGLFLARFVGGLGVGMVTATATAWISELHRVARPGHSPRRAQVVSTAANLGGIGLGPLIGGILAQWVSSPLTVPYVVSLGAMALGLAFVLASPETRGRVVPRPPWHPQRISVPSDARGRYAAAAVGAAISFAVFGLFTSLAPTVLAGTLHHGSPALAGATAFAVLAAAVAAQTLMRSEAPRVMILLGELLTILGFVILLGSVWIPSPSLALFLVGGAVSGAGAGMLFKGVVTLIGAIAPPARRAETLAGMFLAGYIGLSLPVVGLGALTQYLSARVSLLIFAAVLASGIALATRLLNPG